MYIYILAILIVVAHASRCYFWPAHSVTYTAKYSDLTHDAACPPLAIQISTRDRIVQQHALSTTSVTVESGVTKAEWNVSLYII